MVYHRTSIVDGVTVFYREAGNPANPKLLLLGGFPASSHQFRNLIPALADEFHIVAPDYPGFGNSDIPNPRTFAYTFNHLSEIIERFIETLAFRPFGLFMQDYGGPIGFRIMTRRPDWCDWLIIQNANAYEEGLTAAWNAFRRGLWTNRSPETEAALADLLELRGIREIYVHGHDDPELISPDNWNMDYRFMLRKDARRAHMDLFYDYRTNIPLYPKWQQFFRERQPEALIIWGQRDLFFAPEGGEAYLRDLPNAELHKLDSGHFATEDRLDQIVSAMRRFYRSRLGAAEPSGIEVR